MDALKSLITNVPEWIKRLDDLSSQIDQRQLELARVVEPSPTSSPSALSRTKSVRNKGSTESLKPQDEGAVWKEEENANAKAEAVPLTSSPTSPTAGDNTTAVLQHQTSQVMQVAQAKARATLRKRNKRSDSLISAEGGAPKYRTRSMIIVYYDSYVQSFFEELVKFVSASRNMMRKAKMAAKVAHIKRMAELEMPDADEDDKIIEAAAVSPPQVAVTGPETKLTVDLAPTIAVDPTIAAASKDADDTIIAAADTGSQEDLPMLDYTRTMNMRSPGMLASGRPMYMRASGRTAYMGSGARGSYLTGSQQPDIYDELDKGLEYVQSMCEHAAHQFLRDGDCNEEIENVKRRLTETKEQADREMERIKKEDPEALKASEEPVKTRSYRPQSMRKENVGTAVSSSKEASSTGAIAAAKTSLMAIEVDEGIEDMDAEMPKLMYRSTRRR